MAERLNTAHLHSNRRARVDVLGALVARGSYAYDGEQALVSIWPQCHQHSHYRSLPPKFLQAAREKELKSIHPFLTHLRRKMDQLEKLLKELGLSEPRARYVELLYFSIAFTWRVLRTGGSCTKAAK